MIFLNDNPINAFSFYEKTSLHKSNASDWWHEYIQPLRRSRIKPAMTTKGKHKTTKSGNANVPPGWARGPRPKRGAAVARAD